MAYSAVYVPETVTDRLRGSTLMGIFVRIATDPALHIWFGVHKVKAGFDSIDEDGTVYTGGGILQGVPNLEVLLAGKAASVEFVLNGVNPATGAKLLDSIPNVRGALVHIGITTLDDFYQPMSKIVPLWQGVAARVGEESAVVTSDEDPTLTLALSVVGGENMRSRASRSLWSDAQQKALSPTDDFCKSTARLARGVQPVWPLFN